MYSWWLNIITAVAVLAPNMIPTGQVNASARDRVYWHKTVNYNLSRPQQKLRTTIGKKVTSRQAVIPNSQSGKNRVSQPVKILATFDYGESALGVSKVTWAAPLKPAPARCEWARSIVQGYVFDNVEAKRCEGSVYDFEAIRGGKRFSIKVNAINGELIKVEKFEVTSDARAQAENGEELLAQPLAQ
jgi:hypothetical protein